MASSSAETPISPVTTSHPQFLLSPASLNSEPIELDSTPISVNRARRGSKAAALEALAAEKDLSPEEQQLRESLILQRKTDPAVLVDIPKVPAPDELEKAGAAKDEDEDLADKSK